MDCVSESLCKSFVEGNYISLHCNSHTFKYLLQAENSMTSRAYMGEVLIQVWVKSIKK